jgi:hypothetical protein
MLSGLAQANKPHDSICSTWNLSHVNISMIKNSPNFHILIVKLVANDCAMYIYNVFTHFISKNQL